MNITRQYVIEEPQTFLIYEVPQYKNCILDLTLFLRSYDWAGDCVLTLWTTKDPTSTEIDETGLIEEEFSFLRSKVNHLIYTALLMEGGDKLYARFDNPPSVDRDFLLTIQVRGIEDFQ